MRYKFYREHKYVSFALNDLERLVAKTDFASDAELGKVVQELESAVGMLKGHAQYENEKLHELLKKKGSALWEHAEADHLHYDEALENLQDMIGKVKQCSTNEERIEAGYRFYLSFRKFVGDNIAHMHEEETVILPELQRLYSDEELRQVEAETYRIMTAQQLIEMTEVLFPHMNPSDREAFLTDIARAVPEKFAEANFSC